MYKLVSVKQYKEMRKHVKENSKDIFSNIFFVPNDLEKYINEDRVLCEQYEKGFLLILEEEKYYKLYIYADINQKLIIEPMEKKLVFRYTYRRDKGEDCPEIIEECLKESGFVKDGTLVHIRANVEDLYNNCRETEPFIRRLEKKGFYHEEVQEEAYAQIEKMLCSTGMTQDYHLECRDLGVRKVGQVIFNQEREFCAVSLGFAEGKNLSGALMVKEEYRLSGLVAMLSFFRYKWMMEHGIEQNLSWIYVDNEASLKFHKGMGFEFENKYIDEWALEAKKGGL